MGCTRAAAWAAERAVSASHGCPLRLSPASTSGTDQLPPGHIWNMQGRWLKTNVPSFGIATTFDWKQIRFASSWANGLSTAKDQQTTGKYTGKYTTDGETTILSYSFVLHLSSASFSKSVPSGSRCLEPKHLPNVRREWPVTSGSDQGLLRLVKAWGAIHHILFLWCGWTCFRLHELQIVWKRVSACSHLYPMMDSPKTAENRRFDSHTLVAARA